MTEKKDIESWKEGGGHPKGWMPVELYAQDLEGASGAVDTLETEIFGPGYIYKVTHISAVDRTTVVSASIVVGYVSGATFRILSGSKPPVKVPHSWDGEIYLREGDSIKAEFTNTTSGDDIYLVANGIKIPIL